MKSRSIPTSWTVVLRRALCGSGTVGLCVSWMLIAHATPLRAEELSSASYRHLAGSFSASAAAGQGALTSSASEPEIGSSDTVMGGVLSAAPVGSLGTLASLLPGFWPIVVGAFPSLDLDGDLAQFFLDEDDDGDGLDDAYETNTGYFVSETNTGTSPTRADSDGDGYDDGDEILAGSDPNDRFSVPSGPRPVPSLALSLRVVMVVAMLILAARAIPMWPKARWLGSRP